MHPIEKAHKMIIAGNVLSGDGRWVPRNEALKRKRSFLEHVFKGEVERNGRWIKITDVNAKPIPEPITVRESILSEPVQENPFHGKDLFPAEQEKPAAIADSTISEDSPTQQLPRNLAVQQTYHPAPEEPPIELLPPHPAVSEKPEQQNTSHRQPPRKEDPQPVDQSVSTHENLSVELLPSQPTVSQKPEQPEHEHLPEKETITIRTISLGKETTLTISESRAGSALVAICSIQGFIDQGNVEEFQLQLISMKDFGVRYFIIDMEHATLIGSAGWGVIAVTARLIKAAGGLLIICSMKKEIKESFFLLQFNEVVDYQKTITDCLNVFSSVIKNSAAKSAENSNDAENHSLYGESYHDVPIQGKIKNIIAEHGPLSFFRIASLLKQDRYGEVKLNPIKLYFILRELNLESYSKRARFYRSC